jgi:hypothetical protein
MTDAGATRLVDGQPMREEPESAVAQIARHQQDRLVGLVQAADLPTYRAGEGRSGAEALRDAVRLLSQWLDMRFWVKLNRNVARY